MSAITITDSIQKAAVTQLRSKTTVAGLLAAVYTSPTREDATAAATDFVNHLALSDEAAVRTACGDNFDKIQSAFTAQTQSIAESLADVVIDAGRAEAEDQVQTYIDSLQYTADPDSGQDVVSADQSAEAV